MGVFGVNRRFRRGTERQMIAGHILFYFQLHHGAGRIINKLLRIQNAVGLYFVLTDGGQHAHYFSLEYFARNGRENQLRFIARFQAQQRVLAEGGHIHAVLLVHKSHQRAQRQGAGHHAFF